MPLTEIKEFLLFEVCEKSLNYFHEKRYLWLFNVRKNWIWYLSIYLSIYLSLFQSIYLSIYLSGVSIYMGPMWLLITLLIIMLCSFLFQIWNFYNYPQKSQIYCWVDKFQTIGPVNNLNKKAENPRSGRKLTARCSDNMNVVRDSVGRSPKKSLRRCFQELDLSRVLYDKVNQFLLLWSSLTFLKWNDCYLRLRWKMTL